VGFLQNVIRTAVISALGAKMARGRSPIVAALIALLVSRALSGRADEGKPAAGKPAAPGEEGGLGGLIDRFRQGGLEDNQILDRHRSEQAGFAEPIASSSGRGDNRQPFGRDGLAPR
jgi:hypothetical protein